MDPKEPIKVSYLPDALCTSSGHAYIGTKLFESTLDNLLEYCYKMPKNKEKHKDGSMFAYIKDTLGAPKYDERTKENFHNGGVVLLDLDYLPKDITELLYDNFDFLCKKIPFLYAVQYSSSYYLKPNEKTGLHLFGRSVELDDDEYGRLVGLGYAWLAYVVKNKWGIDLTTCGVKGHETKVLDKSAKLSQRFYLYHSEYKKNQFALPANPDNFDKDIVDLLKKEYPDYINTKRVRPISIDSGEYTVKQSDNPNKKCYEYNEHWKMIDVLYMCGFKDEDIVNIMLDTYDDINKDGKGYWSQRHGGMPLKAHFEQMVRTAHAVHELSGSEFRRGVQLLESVGVYVTNGDIHIPEGKRIYHFRKEIMEFIEKHKRTLIEAGTGTGKTTLINGSKQWGVDSMAKDLNAVVVVPYLASRAPYDSLEVVSSEEGNDVPKDRPCVMVIDQAFRHWNEIKDRVIIIDESHQLFLDRSFRKRCVLLMTMLKEWDGRLICFTATPTGEIDLLGLSKLKFTQNRSHVTVTVQNTDSVEWSILLTIKSALDHNRYDRVVLFDNRGAKKIYEWLFVNGYGSRISYLRSETKDLDDFHEVCDNHTLTKDLTICTNVAYNGINFNNKGEKILVVGRIRNGETTPAQLIQCIGRVRYSKVIVKLFYDPDKGDDSVEKHRDKALKYDTVIRDLNLDPDLFVGLYNTELLDKDFAEAWISVDNYCRSFTDFGLIPCKSGDIMELLNGTQRIEKLLDGLTKFDYIDVVKNEKYWSHMVETEHTDKDGKTEKRKTILPLNLKVKMRESAEFWEMLENEGENVLNYEFSSDYVINYKEEFQQKLKKVLKYNGVTVKTVLDMRDESKNGILVETILNRIDEICRVCSVTDKDWTAFTMSVHQICDSLDNQDDKRKFINKFNEMKRIRNDKQRYIYKQDETITFDLVFKELLDEMETNKEKSIKKMSDGGRKGGKKTKPIKFKTPAYLPPKLKPYGGKKFKSCSEAAAEIGCTDDTITNYLKKGYCFEC